MNNKTSDYQWTSVDNSIKDILNPWVILGYRFVVVSLAIIALGLLFIQTSVVAFIAKTQLDVKADFGPNSTSPNSAELTFLLNRSIDQALSEPSLTSIRDSYQENKPSEGITASDYELLRHRININVIEKDSQSSRLPRVTFEISEQSQSQANELLFSVLERFRQDFHELKSDKLKQLQDQQIVIAENVKEKISATDFRLQQSKNDLRQIELEIKDLQDKLVLERSKKIDQPKKVEKKKNTDWVKAQQELTDVLNRYEQALINLNLAHPKTQTLQAEVKQKKDALKNIPEYLVLAISVPSSKAPSPAESDLTSQIAKKRREREILDTTINDLEKKIANHKSEIPKFEEQKQLILKQYQTIQSFSLAEENGHVTSTKLGGNFPTHRLFILFILAFIISAVVIYFYAKNESPLFFDMKKLKEALNLPLLGAIPATDDSVAPLEIPFTGRLSKWTIHTSEFLLVGITMVVLFALLTDPSFTEVFTADPFSSLTKALKFS